MQAMSPVIVVLFCQLNLIFKHKKVNYRKLLKPLGIWNLNSANTEFHKTETEYLRFIINPEGVPADPVKAEAVEIWGTS